MVQRLGNCLWELAKRRRSRYIRTRPIRSFERDGLLCQDLHRMLAGNLAQKRRCLTLIQSAPETSWKCLAPVDTWTTHGPGRRVRGSAATGPR